jgi:hypothetical protein
VVPLNRLSLPLSLKKVVEEARVSVLRLELLGFEVNDLSKLVNVLRALNNQSYNLLNRHQQSLLRVLMILSLRLYVALACVRARDPTPTSTNT